MIADLPIEYFIGEGFIPIAKQEIRRLISAQPKVVSNYIIKA